MWLSSSTNEDYKGAVVVQNDLQQLTSAKNAPGMRVYNLIHKQHIKSYQNSPSFLS